MRAKLGKLVWKQVEKSVSDRFPSFELFVKRPDALRWKLKASNVLFFYITTHKFERDDCFAIDVHWNIIDELPLRMLGRPEIEDFIRDRASYRIQLFLRDRSIINHFDLDPEYSLQLRDFDYEKANQVLKETGVYPSAIKTDVDVLIARAPAMIEDALDMLVAHGIPFFRQVAKAHGVNNLNL
jgi:hypothetical protein